MCKILNVSFSDGKVNIKISSGKDLTDNTLELYMYDFFKEAYEMKSQQKISRMHRTQDGYYSFSFANCKDNKLKFVIKNSEDAIFSEERYVGERHKIKILTESSKIGTLYKVTPDISISRSVVFYESGKSKTKITLPSNLEGNQTLIFTIKNNDFVPKFKICPDYEKYFIIEK